MDRTEKRHAKSGEWILVVDASNSEGLYENGDRMKVISANEECGLLWVKRKGYGQSRLSSNEYEFIIGEETEQ